MFDEPEERRDDTAGDPRKRLEEKLDELLIYAELAAIFEGPRKFGSRLLPSLSIEEAREIQRTIASLERSKEPGIPVVPKNRQPDAIALFRRVEQLGLSPGDYHFHRRPGEVMLVRWLDPERTDLFYQRMQAHIDAMLEQAREEERQALSWRQDPATQQYLEGLDKANCEAEGYYARVFVTALDGCVLSTVTTHDMNILFLSRDYMGIEPAELVGPASAPEDEFDEAKLGWYFRLFSLRGRVDGKERMLFFVFLQRAEDDFDFDGDPGRDE